QPGRDSLQELEGIKRDRGSYIFSAQQQQCPQPPEGNTVKRADMKYYKEAPAREKFRHVYLACDPAGATGARNDYTAIVVAGVIERDVYVLEVQRGHWNCRQIVSRIEDLAKHWRASRLMIETTGQGEAVKQEISRRNRYDIRGITQKLDKETRMS